MALTSSEQGIAHYMHATLERFASAAVRDITAHFHNAAHAKGAQPGSLSLSYDEQDHVFTLSCHSDIGAQLDEALGHMIRDYVAGETADVTRFEECAYGDPFDDYEIQLEDGIQLDEPQDAPSPAATTFTIHIANFDGINPHGKTKGFRLRELPPELRNRTVTRHSTSHLADAVSLRRVRWDEPSAQHVFDGNIGQRLPRLSVAQHEDMETLFDLLPFTAFKRTITVTVPQEKIEDAKQWEFVRPHEEPTIGQWLEGMGETRQVNPDAAPEIALDAIKYASGQLIRQNTVGRLRMPQGVNPAELRPAEATDEPDRSETSLNDNFAALLRTNANDESDTESSNSSSTEGSELVNRLPTITDSVNRQPPITPVRPLPSAPPGLSENTNRSMIQAINRSDESFPTYERSYAKTDRWGLTGVPSNQVLWENENATINRSGGQRRAPTTYEEVQGERAESDSTVLGVGASSVTPMSYKETVLGGSEPWANNVVPPQMSIPIGTLITTGEGRSPAPLLPPGLFPPLGSKGYQVSHTSPVNRQQASSQTSISQMDVSTEEPLIQLDQDEPPLIERLQRKPEDQPHLFKTMRQQAKSSATKKKNKGKGSGNNAGSKSATPKSAVSQRAALEMPSPPPPPKQRNEAQQPGHHSRSPAKTNSGAEGDHEDLSPTMLEQAVYRLTSSTLDKDSRVIVQFGIALLTDGNDLVTSRAMRRDDLQQNLDNKSCSTCFPQILGRERVDGEYLLQLPAKLSSPLPPRTGETRLIDAYMDTGRNGIIDRRLYEVKIVVSGGREWTLCFDESHPEDAKILPSNEKQQSIYIHYPQRVWDARVRPEAQNSQQFDGEEEIDGNLEESILLFIKTLNSPPEAADTGSPGFEAVIPQNSTFGVTNVLAKREFYQVLAPGSAWIVSQVWDLHVQSTNANVTVSAKREAVMEKEGRLWWEAALQYDGQEGLEAAMNEIVEKLNCVGSNWTRPEPKKEKADKKKKQARDDQYVPYW